MAKSGIKHEYTETSSSPVLFQARITTEAKGQLPHINAYLAPRPGQNIEGFILLV